MLAISGYLHPNRAALRLGHQCWNKATLLHLSMRREAQSDAQSRWWTFGAAKNRRLRDASAERNSMKTFMLPAILQRNVRSVGVSSRAKEPRDSQRPSEVNLELFEISKIHVRVSVAVERVVMLHEPLSCERIAQGQWHPAQLGYCGPVNPLWKMAKSARSTSPSWSRSPVQQSP